MVFIRVYAAVTERSDLRHALRNHALRKKEKYICKQCVHKYPYPCKNACVCVCIHTVIIMVMVVLLF